MSVSYNEPIGPSNNPTGMKYDPKTGSWTPSYAPTSKGGKSNTASNGTAGDSNGGLGTDKKDSAAGKAKKEAVEIESNTLTAEVPLVPSNKTLAIKARDTVAINGVGKYLSGNYYVTNKTVALDTSSGITVSISVVKSKFADNMKTPTELSEDDIVTLNGPEPEPRVEPVELEYADTLRVGDKVKLFDPSELGVSTPVANGVLTVSKIKEDNTKVLLRELFCWVETDFVYKV